ncbi:oligopeptide/dipeptide ABC transporter ATP-binding protein [Streptomyces sp. TE33382]
MTTAQAVPAPRGSGGSKEGAAYPPVLEISALERHFAASGGGTVRAVDGVSITIGRGEVVGLVGESGSGKSAVGRCAVRLDEPNAGTVRINGTDVTHLSRRALRPPHKDFHLVFQDPSSSLDPRMTIGQIIAEPIRLHRRARGAAVRERAEQLLGQVGLRPEHADRHPHELSGGQRQRISIARALSCDPDLVIADEPTSALDVSVQASVLNLLADLQRDRGFGCLFITHDLAAVEFLADRIAVMYLGQIVEQAPTAELFSAPKHPYTQALLSAAPVPDPVLQRSRERIVLHGELPSPLDPPPGCRFHTRCPLATDGGTRGDTCHVDIVDRWGNMVSATPSGGWLQSNPVVPELGFPLGTRLQMAWLEEGLPNSLTPGRRPRTTLTPSLALRDGVPVMAFGTPGGDQQDQWQLHFFLAVALRAEVRGGLDLQGAIDAPNWHNDSFPGSFLPRGMRPGSVTVEEGMDPEVVAELRRRGHDVTVGSAWSEGRMCAVARDPETGVLSAAANPRGMQGYAVGR